MYNVIFLLIAGSFGAILVFNIFYRVKIFKLYKYLVQNRIVFTSRHFFNEKKMEEEVLSRYPEHRVQILAFVRLIKHSMTVASVLILVIIVLGLFLLRNR